MLRAMAHTVDLLGVRDAVGEATYTRGAQYARQQRVTQMRWDDAEAALHGTVRGSGGTYQATAYFGHHETSLVFEQGDCDCPVGFDCKHVVALLLTAAGQKSPRVAARRAPQPPTWEQSLGALLESGPAANQPGTTPLAGGHRALVFSQFTGFLAQVRSRLDADGVEYCYWTAGHGSGPTC